MLVRRAEARDLAGIFAIYDDEILHGTATFDTEPVPEERQILWLAAHQSERHPAIVAEEDSSIVLGWASLSPWSDRCAYARAAEVSVYVHRDYRGRGVGRALLTDLVRRGRSAGLGVLLARITSESEASVDLHRALGFTTIGTMRRVGEKFGRILDVALMDLHLDGA